MKIKPFIGWLIGYNFVRFKGNYQYEGRDTNVTRFYSPNSIKRVDKSYMLLVNYLKSFYCGEVTDLSGLALSILSDESGIYVPADLYDDFIETTEEFARCQIKKANVVYMLDENTYYYVDFYENGSKILYLPPLPQKQGYTLTVGILNQHSRINGILKAIKYFKQRIVNLKT